MLEDPAKSEEERMKAMQEEEQEKLLKEFEYVPI